MIRVEGLGPGIFATRLVIGTGPKGVEVVEVSKTATASAAWSSQAMNSRLCFRARDLGGLGPRLTKRFRSAKARFASNSPPGAKPGVFGLAGCKQPRLGRHSERPTRQARLE
jgi:hypothetical protein